MSGTRAVLNFARPKRRGARSRISSADDRWATIRHVSEHRANLASRRGKQARLRLSWRENVSRAQGRARGANRREREGDARRPSRAEAEYAVLAVDLAPGSHPPAGLEKCVEDFREDVAFDELDLGAGDRPRGRRGESR